MKIVGLTGSIAMGKSEVAKIIGQLGIPVFDADKEVHQLYDSPEGGKLLQDCVPEAIVAGHVDRAKLSAIVLNDPRRLDQLESIVHAEIAQRRDAFLNAARRVNERIVVLDIPLLFEKNLEHAADVTVVVSAPESLQHQRALARPGMTKQRLEKILLRQMPDAEKRRRADHVIENTGTLDDLQLKTRLLFSALTKTREKPTHDS